MGIRNQKGSVLIAVYMVLFVLLALSSSVAMLNFSELNDARRHRDATAAFWLAEAGINRFLVDTGILEGRSSIVFSESNGTIQIQKDDTNPKFLVVVSTGTVGGSRRRIEIEYPSLSTIFENTISSKGDVRIEGRKTSLLINDKLRLSGEVVETSAHPLVFIEDKQEHMSEALTAITYPDVNHNGIADEFSDFVAFNRNLIAAYPQEEVVYIQGNETYAIVPDQLLKGKKIVYIEGDREGSGNAVIQFSGALDKTQNLTIIATGTVRNNQAGIAPEGAQLNIIAWSDYFESAALPSLQRGMIYTHATAYFDEIHDTSVTNGGLVANQGVVFGEIWSTKIFNYADTRAKGIVPPGFEGLVGGNLRGYTEKPSSWKEI